MCHGHVAFLVNYPTSSTERSVALTVSDVSTMKRVSRRVRVMTPRLRKAERMSQIMIVRSLVERRLPLHTRRLATQTVNALRQEGPRLKHRPKNLRGL
jgi:hypothetical protein